MWKDITLKLLHQQSFMRTTLAVNIKKIKSKIEVNYGDKFFLK